MKKYFRIKAISVTIAILIIGFVFINFHFPLIDGDNFLGMIVALSTLYYGFLVYKIEDDKMFKDLFESFNNKYDNKFNDFLNEIRSNKSIEINAEKKDKIIDYFNLSAEEYLWYRKGRIPNDVWKAWESGMVDNINLPQILKIFIEETKTENGKESYYGLYEKIEPRLKKYSPDDN